MLTERRSASQARFAIQAVLALLLASLPLVHEHPQAPRGADRPLQSARSAATRRS